MSFNLRHLVDDIFHPGQGQPQGRPAPAVTPAPGALRVNNAPNNQRLTVNNTPPPARLNVLNRPNAGAIRVGNTLIDHNQAPDPVPVHPSLAAQLRNHITSGAGSFAHSLVDMTGVPAAIDTGRLGVAELTHNQPAIDAATTRLAGNVPRFLPVSLAEGVKPFAQDVATAVTSPYAERSARQQADYARKVLNGNSGDPIHNAQVEAYASAVENELLNQQLNTAGIDQDTSTGTVARQVGGHALEAGANIAMAGAAPEAMTATNLRTAASFGGLNAASAVGTTAATPDASFGDYLKNAGESFAVGAALPLGMKAGGKVAEVGTPKLVDFAKNNADTVARVTDSLLNNPRPTRLSDSEMNAVSQWRQQMGSGNFVDDNLYHSAREALAREGISHIDGGSIDSLLGKFNTYKNRKLEMQGGYVSPDSPLLFGIGKLIGKNDPELAKLNELARASGSAEEFQSKLAENGTKVAAADAKGFYDKVQKEVGLEGDIRRANPNLEVKPEDSVETKNITYKNIQQQASKQIKDSGEKMFGSKKDLAKIRRIGHADLAYLETQGERAANNLVTKERVLGDGARYEVKRNGDPGLEHLKHTLISSIPKRPLANAGAREAFVKFLPKFVETVNNAGSHTELVDKVVNEFRRNMGYSDRMEFKKNFGTKFYNIVSGNSDAIRRAVYRPATDFSFADKVASTTPRDTTGQPTLHGGELVPYKRQGSQPAHDSSPQAIRDGYKFKGLEYGNYVRDAEAKDHLARFGASIHDIGQVAGIDMAGLIDKMKLGIGFGSRGGGKALAHYEPSNKVINITKKSGADGTLGHEFAHALDDFLGSGRVGRDSYASSGNAANPAIRQAMGAVMRAIKEGNTRITIEAKEGGAKGLRYSSLDRLLEKHGNDAQKAVDEMLSMYPGTKGKVLQQAVQYALAKSGAKTVEVPVRRSAFFAAAENQGDYWKRDTELFARAFSDYLRVKSADKGIINNYMARTGHGGVLFSPENMHEIAPAIDNLMATVKQEIGVGDAPAAKPMTAAPKPVEAPASPATAKNNELINKVESARPNAPEAPKTKTYETIHQGGVVKRVEGQPVDLVKGVETYLHKDENGNWVVSEAKTGRSLTSGGYPDQHHALQEARSNIRSVGEDKFRELINQHQIDQPKPAAEPKASPVQAKNNELVNKIEGARGSKGAPLTPAQKAMKEHEDKLAKAGMTQNEYADLHRQIQTADQEASRLHSEASLAFDSAEKNADGTLTDKGQEQARTAADAWSAALDKHLELLNKQRAIDGLEPIKPSDQAPKTPAAPPAEPKSAEAPVAGETTPPQSVSEDASTVKLNTKRLNVSEEAQARLDQQTTEIINKLSNKEVEQAARDAGIDMKSYGVEGTKKKIAEQLNLRNKVVSAEKQIADARANGAGADEIAHLIKESADLGRISRTQGTDVARQLQARRIVADALATPSQKVFRLLDEAGVNPEVYSKRLANVDFNNTDEVVRAFRDLVPAKFHDWLDKYRYTNMLSSPLTHIVNMTSNLQGLLGVAPVQKFFEGGIDAVRAGITGQPRSRFAGEAGSYLKGAVKSLPEARKKFADVMTGKNNIEMPDTEAIRNGKLAYGGAKGFADTILTVVPKFLEAADQFTMTAARSGERAALDNRMSKGVQVTGDIEGKVEDAAKYRVFRQELGREGQGYFLDTIDWLPKQILQARRSKNPVISTTAKFTLPFVTTPVNLFKQGIEYSPAGIMTLAGNAEKTAQLAKMTMGTSVVAIAAGVLAGNDSITFSEPSNSDQRDAFRAEGKQPYAIKVGGHWFGYSKLHPAIAFNLAIVGAVKQAYDEGAMSESDGNKLLEAAAGTLGFFRDQSYMKSVGDFTSSLQLKDAANLETAFTSMASNWGNQLSPFKSMVSWIGRQIDPTQRKVDTSASAPEQIYQNLVKDIPGLNKAVPARINPYTGQPLMNDNPVLNSYSPVRVTNDKGYGNTTSLNVDQRQQQYDLPIDQRGLFRQGVIEDKFISKQADQQKADIKKGGDGKNFQPPASTGNSGSSNPEIKQLVSGKYYTKVGTKYQTYDTQQAAEEAVAKNKLATSSAKTAEIGNKTYYKKSDGTIASKSTVEYQTDKQVSHLNLQLEQTKRADDLAGWKQAAVQKFQALQKKAAQYDPETESDQIDALQVQADSLIADMTKYGGYGGFTKPKTGRARGRSSNGISYKLFSPVAQERSLRSLVDSARVR